MKSLKNKLRGFVWETCSYGVSCRTGYSDLNKMTYITFENGIRHASVDISNEVMFFISDEVYKDIDDNFSIWYSG